MIEEEFNIDIELEELARLIKEGYTGERHMGNIGEDRRRKKRRDSRRLREKRRNVDLAVLKGAKASVGEGWWPLLDRTLKKISDMGWDGEIFDVKEKFGQLDITIGHASEEIHAALLDAWKESVTICERCGKPGRPRVDRRWVKTLCDECAKVR